MIGELTEQEKLWIAQRLYARAREKARNLLRLDRRPDSPGKTISAANLREDIATCNRLAMKLQGIATVQDDAPVMHSDDFAVIKFSSEMRRKLALKRREGFSGWDDPSQCSINYLSILLRKHVEKGDPVDVANLAMMIHQRGGSILKVE